MILNSGAPVYRSAPIAAERSFKSADQPTDRMRHNLDLSGSVGALSEFIRSGFIRSGFIRSEFSSLSGLNLSSLLCLNLSGLDLSGLNLSGFLPAGRPDDDTTTGRQQRRCHSNRQTANTGSLYGCLVFVYYFGPGACLVWAGCLSSMGRVPV